MDPQTQPQTPPQAETPAGPPGADPLALSFVGQPLFVRRLSARQVRVIRDAFDKDEDGAVIDLDGYTDRFIENVVVRVDGTPHFAPGEPGGLFEPHYREVRREVNKAYTVAEPGKNSPAAATSPAS